jgi:hypothetical protein
LAYFSGDTSQCEKLSEIKPTLKLPISAISYGKIIFEAQAAKVFLGPLVCQPKENLYDSEEHLKNIEKKIDDKFTSHDSRIEELEEKLNETIDNMVQGDQLLAILFNQYCLSNLENYHMIDGYCLYFETESFDYESAQQNCDTKFSGGKIFEPLTKSINDRVYGEFKQITGKEGWVWVGVTDEANEGVFRYAGSGVPVSNHMTPTWTISSEPDGGRSENCVMVYTVPTHSYFKKWKSYTCTYKIKSVCESK